ncbi:hypothetical protein OIDMADRAFT_33842 [Oidiodendron maius Zn]|uniref:Apple domain-containing protein n=1 Tax=Oidiodendron maius (strain Zn) TaxID=913774 RepID=A0A0C3GWZ0_OIDMZ|nr:hypothetical protein OIDMADRAFT_33842 [Oidiodendron maius Zn]
MHSFTSTIIFASGLVSLASAAALPLEVRSTCGSIPSGTATHNPLAQPTGINTASACQASCEANSSCQAFCFGTVNNEIECKLFAVPAAQVPAQSSNNLLVFDKACTSVPNVVPTASDPTGANEPVAEKANTPEPKTSVAPKPKTTGLPKPKPSVLPKPKTTELSPPKTTELPPKTTELPPAKTTELPKSKTTELPKSKTTELPKSKTTELAKPQSTEHLLAARNQCGGAPIGPSANKVAPISTPGSSTLKACRAFAKASPSCKSFEFGTLTPRGPPVCRLFAVPAAKVPAPPKGQSLVVYDIACPL